MNATQTDKVTLIERLGKGLAAPYPIYPLVSFRILFGLMMLISIIRFALKGWIYELYIGPNFYFPYFGFEWVQPLGGSGMYILFVLMGLGTLGIMLGALYRVSAVLFFVTFTYVELIDKTNYLNHYYFVSIVGFLMILLPAARAYSIDAKVRPELLTDRIPFWTVGIIRFQLALVYFFAGVAKLHPDWLFEAMPMRLWLPAKSHLPLIGSLLNYETTAYIFSWSGAIYDLFIAFFLLYTPTRKWAYVAVVIFHGLTALLFQIGMFPYIMILATLVFFSAGFHKRLLAPLGDIPPGRASAHTTLKPLTSGLLIVFVVIQLLLPFRYLLYPGKLFWNEEGYRFSWRVMLMEKAGYAQFTVLDPTSGIKEVVSNYDYLTPNQEKMMSTQPDMILQFAHFLKDIYQSKGFNTPEVYVECYVTLNGRRSQPFVDPTVNLAAQPYSLAHRPWVLPYNSQ